MTTFDEVCDGPQAGGGDLEAVSGEILHCIGRCDQHSSFTVTALERRWVSDAACRGLSTEIFFPGKDANGHVAMAEAMAVCATCPVAAYCAEWAIHHEDYGVWGGLSNRARERIRKERGISYVSPEFTHNFAGCDGEGGHRHQAECGTRSGYLKHQRMKETPCRRCLDAAAAWARNYRKIHRNEN